MVRKSFSPKFRVGHRVRVNRKVGLNDSVGAIGTVRVIIENVSLPYGVEFDEKIRGHALSLEGTIHSQKCDGWWVKEDDLEHIHELDAILGV